MPLDPADLSGLTVMTGKSADRPMALPRAPLECLGNRTDIADVITIDRDDFAVYRPVRPRASRIAVPN